MTTSERVIQVIADLDAIDFYDRVMFSCGICDDRVLSNMITQDKLLMQLERLDDDAYLAYLCDERDVINKYYSRRDAQ